MIHHRDTEAQRKSFFSAVECLNNELFSFAKLLLLAFGFLCASVSLW